MCKPWVERESNVCGHGFVTACAVTKPCLLAAVAAAGGRFAAHPAHVHIDIDMDVQRRRNRRDGGAYRK